MIGTFVPKAKPFRRAVGLTLAAALAAFAGTAPVWAHHSTAAYDYSKQAELTGTVTVFQWTNPHMFIKLRAPDARGKVVEYNIECGTPNINVRHGWKETDIKKGDRISIQYSPMRNGTPAGTLITVKLADGRTLYGPAYDIRGAGAPGPR